MAYLIASLTHFHYKGIFLIFLRSLWRSFPKYERIKKACLYHTFVINAQIVHWDKFNLRKFTPTQHHFVAQNNGPDISKVFSISITKGKLSSTNNKSDTATIPQEPISTGKPEK